MSEGKYIVLKTHESSYPEPITFEKGAALKVGEKYDGSEGWENWFWCHANGQKPGWVPGEVIEFIDKESARALESYTAKELTVGKGQKVRVQKILNGWAWCELDATDEAGWVPLANLCPSES
jgi:hypothetical protein